MASIEMIIKVLKKNERLAYFLPDGIVTEEAANFPHRHGSEISDQTLQIRICI